MIRWQRGPWLVAYALLLTLSVIRGPVFSSDHEAAVARLGEDIRYLSSDELEGRGVGTAGLEKAADYIRGRFKSLGIDTTAGADVAMTPFPITVGSEVAKQKTYLKLKGPRGEECSLSLGEEYQPLTASGAEPKTADVVFAGYGISAPNLNYDDYQGADVAGKVVVVIRREPQQGNEQSVFDGTRDSIHASFNAKVQAASKAGAAAILLVNDPFTTSKEQKDELSRAGAIGRGPGRVPFAHLKQAVVDNMLRQTPIKAGDKELTSIAAVAASIDETLTPLTQPLPGWTAQFAFAFETITDEVSNVAAVIEGEGPLADETIVIGAHYDHVGYGSSGSLRPGARVVHNGADDNASGTAAVMELARRYSTRDAKPARRLLFIGFTAEERGLLGSNHYLNNPLFPLENTVAMLNFDMIGHVDVGGLQLNGVSSAKEFPAIVEKLSEGLDFTVIPAAMAGGSDHAGFYRRNIPFLFFFTGITETYHTPDDDFETIDVEGVAKTIDFAERVLDEIIAMPARPEFTKMQGESRRRRASTFLGIRPDFSTPDGGGVRCAEVTPESPAAKADIRVGDVITKIGDFDVTNMMGLMSTLGKFKGGDQVKIVVRRGAEVLTLDVTLATPGGAP